MIRIMRGFISRALKKRDYCRWQFVLTAIRPILNWKNRMNVLPFSRLELEDYLIEEARKITAKECMQVLKAMPENKKHALGVMLSEMANADGEFSEDEYRLVFNILLEAGIDIESALD